MSSSTVALAGDWHGNAGWARSVIAAAGQLGISRIYHLGDFGVWPGSKGQDFLNWVSAALHRESLHLWVTPGNHEDYNQIAEIPVGDDGLQWVRENIALIPRGHRWEDGGRSFVSLGGAPSIDFEWRTEGHSWWAEEMIRPEDVVATVQGGHADIMLAHDAPDGGTVEVAAIIDNPSGWTERGLAYAAQGRELMNHAVAGVRPKVFAHGHYHAWDDTGPAQPTRYLSLGCDEQSGNLALLRLADLAVSWDGKTWR